jgi:o-succinylbenzoate synthase
LEGDVRAITVESVSLYPLHIPFVEPFVTSFGEEPFKAGVVVEVTTTTGVTGWGEASVELYPGYGAETVATGMHILENFAVPRVFGKTIEHPRHIPALLKSVRGNAHARAGMEAALWDAFAKSNEMRLADLFAACLPEGNASRGKATVGVSIGIMPTIEKQLEIVRKRVAQGYARIKLKIQPGWDVDVVRAIRAEFPDIVMMVDANSAYTPADADHLAQLDQFDLLMIEQPLGHEDIYDHSRLQPRLRTSVCLDESVKSANDLRLALDVGAMRILNLKPARVGGFSESLDIYTVCTERDTPLWIGGMLECGIGRAANVAFASLPGITLPCDISATDRYFRQDVTEPPFVLNADSTLDVPDDYGIGVDVVRERIEESAARWNQAGFYK